MPISHRSTTRSSSSDKDAWHDSQSPASFTRCAQHSRQASIFRALWTNRGCDRAQSNWLRGKPSELARSTSRFYTRGAKRRASSWKGFSMIGNNADAMNTARATPAAAAPCKSHPSNRGAASLPAKLITGLCVRYSV